MTHKNTLSGHCHCGNIKFELRTNKSAKDFTPRTCQCTLCQHHGADWISDPDGHLEIHYDNSAHINKYRFGHATADFIICKKCGVMPFALCEVKENTHAVINIKAMPETNFTTAPTQTIFNDETPQSRLERRAKNWTGKVSVSKR